jgi:hypothetical protein
MPEENCHGTIDQTPNPDQARCCSIGKDTDSRQPPQPVTLPQHEAEAFSISELHSKSTANQLQVVGVSQNKGLEIFPEAAKEISRESLTMTPGEDHG